MRSGRLGVLLALLGSPALAGPLTGKSYMVEMSSTQVSSGYAGYLLPPLLKELAASDLVAHNTPGPGADVVFNITPDSDNGHWVTQGGKKRWLYAVRVTVGISPESYVIPVDGTPAFGVTARLTTPDPDREDEMDCLIRLAARTAIRDYRPKGAEAVDGQACARK